MRSFRSRGRRQKEENQKLRWEGINTVVEADRAHACAEEVGRGHPEKCSAGFCRWNRY